jgi:hypothetical protein
MENSQKIWNSLLSFSFVYSLITRNQNFFWQKDQNRKKFRYERTQVHSSSSSEQQNFTFSQDVLIYITKCKKCESFCNENCKIEQASPLAHKCLGQFLLLMKQISHLKLKLQNACALRERERGKREGRERQQLPHNPYILKQATLCSKLLVSRGVL